MAELEPDVKAIAVACVVCSSQNNLKRCSRCKNVFYCSRDHQKQDWSKHRTLCNSFVSNETNDFNFNNSQTVGKTNRSPRAEGDITTNSEFSQEQEIAQIMDFSAVKLPDDPKLAPQAKTKDIFNELMVSDTDNFSGPAVDTAAEENDFTPFDTRPLRRLKFPKPDSYSHRDLAEFIVIRLINLGYCVVDEVFEDETIDGIISEIKDLQDKNQLKTGQLAGGRTSGNDSEKVTETNIRSDTIKWVKGNEEGLTHTSQALLTMDSITGFFNAHMRNYGFIKGRTKAMLACYPGNGTYYRRHVDNPSKDGRRVTCILYLNKDWDIQKDGGLLRIFPPNQDKPVDVPPLANRLLFFWSDNRNPHEVQPAFRERFAMTVWYFDAQEREEAKVEELQQETEKIHQQIAELEEKKRQMQEMTEQQYNVNRVVEIQTRAMEAVMALSPQELQAISFLIDNHPDPKQVLSSMGISEAIQEALVVYLSQQSESRAS